MLIKFSLEEISFWDVMAWANQTQGDNDNDVLLNELRFMNEDSFEKCHVEKGLLKLLPSSDEETLSKLLFQEHLERVRDEQIKPSVFTDFIIRSVREFEEDETLPMCKDIYRVFNYYNGYGFMNLASMKNSELFEEISEFIGQETI